MGSFNTVVHAAPVAPVATVATGGSWLPWFIWLVLVLFILLCTVVAVFAAVIATQRLQEMQQLAREAGWRFGGMREGTSDMARQAAAWGAEVLAGVANGASVNQAIEQSAATIRLPTVTESRRYAASEAGSDVSRVSELQGFGNGEDWIERAARSVGSQSPFRYEGERAMQVYEHQLYQASAPVRRATAYHTGRASVSPPRAH